MTPINETHDPQLKSWVESANRPGTDFPIQNLPFGVFQTTRTPPRAGVAIGDFILDVGESGLQPARSSLNDLMSQGPEYWANLRRLVSRFLREGSPTSPNALIPRADAEMLIPAQIGDYTDFYASIHHATNVGALFRPDNPLLPNYKYIPIGYHGRASSILISGAAITRPSGQLRPDPSKPPTFGPSRLLDYELEVGAFIGPGNDLGSPVPLGEAEDHLFGICLLNDWSARDIQSWEYQPLGPFLAKSFATSISPWIVTMEALAPYRVPARPRPEGDPQPLPYLNDPADQSHGGISLNLEVSIQSEQMRRQGMPPHQLSQTNFQHMYWTLAQMVAHHTSNGCNLRPGDLIASGTVSGPTETEHGCLLEMTRRGTKPVALPTGEERRFLEDGDEVIFRGWLEREGFARIGVGECRGVTLASFRTL